MEETTAIRGPRAPDVHGARDLGHPAALRGVASLWTWPFHPQVTGRIAAITLTEVVAVLGWAAVDYFLVGP